MEKVEVNEILNAIKKIKKVLPKKLAAKRRVTDEEEKEFQNTEDSIIQLDYLTNVFERMALSYKFLKMYSGSKLSEAVTAVSDCMKKLYSILVELLKTVQ